MGYALAAAVRHLREEGLLAGLLLPGRDGMHPAAEPGRPGVEFLGAGLDSRRLQPGALFVALAGEKVDGRRFAPDALARGHWVLTRPVGDDDPLAAVRCPGQAGVLLSAEPEKALACLGRRWRLELGIQVLAITGTNGKTTTKDLARALLSGAGPTQATPGNFNNQLGLPLTLLNLRPETRYAVIEMGASAVGEIAFLAGLARPDVGLITNASAAHLEEFGSLENIILGKGELLEELPAHGRAILNADSPGFADWSRRAVCSVISWGRERGDHRWSHDPAAETLLLDGVSWSVPLPGEHNAANLCAAILACRALGAEDEALRAGLAGFAGSEHRGRLLDWRRRRVLDDSYNANPGSMLAAARTLSSLRMPGRKVAVLGRMAELGPDAERLHEETGRALAGEGLDLLLAVGEGAAGLARGFETLGEARTLGTHEEAFTWLQIGTAAGDAILVKGSRSAAMDRVIQMMEQDTEK